MLTLTEAAVNYYQSYLNDFSSQHAVIFSVEKSGCSGLRYQTRVAVPEPDYGHDQHGLTVYVDEDSVPALDAVLVDCEQLALGQKKIVYRNRLAKHVCGCGELALREADEAQ